MPTATETTHQLPSIPPLPGDLAAEAATKSPLPYEKEDNGSTTLSALASTAEECLEDLNQKLPAVTNKKQPPPPFKRVIKTSFNFKSDIDTSSSSSNEEHICGIIHATKSSTSNGEQHVFGWIDNINNNNCTQSIINYLHKYGYKSTSTTKFIPYTSKECWHTKYPHATIQFEYVDGKVIGNVEWESKNNPIIAAAAAASAGKKKKSSSSKVSKKKKKLSPKLIQRGTLPNLERNELHYEIYNYFHWLHDELVQLETNHTGRRQVSNANISVPAVRGLLGKMEGAFKMLAELKEKKEEKEKEEQRDETNTSGGTTLPYLEHALELELQHRVLKNNNSSSSSSNSTTLTADGGDMSSSTNAAAASTADQQPKINDFRMFDFDTLFQKLVDFKTENGHVSPPSKHPELGKWVSELRAKKKLLRENGMEYEQEPEQQQEEEDGSSTQEIEVEEAATTKAAEEEGKEPKKKKRKKEKKKKQLVDGSSSNTYLTQIRVQQLDSISFQWTLGTRVSWEDRFEELRQFKITNGRFPTNKEGTLGNW